ncbi:MAG: hypothetical protein K1V97_01395 [Lachnospiraceae bacterium]
MTMNENNAKKTAEKSASGVFRNLIYNNKLAMLFSLILAFGIWIWVAIEKSPVVEITVSAVPVKIDMENSVPAQLHLQTFGQTEFYVDVTVTGKRFVVSALTPEDLTVTAQTNYVDSAGTKSLQLKATANDSRDYEIQRISQNYIDVYFDTYKEAEFAIEPRILAPDDKTVVDGCILGSVLFSKNTVVVSGPSAEVNKVTGVIAETSVSAPLSATTTVQPEIKLQTDGQETLSYVELNTGESTVTMTMPVLKKVVLPTSVTFKNAPGGYLNGDVPVTVSPSQIEAAVPIEKVGELKSISVGTVDFAELDSGYNTFNFKASDITEYTVVDSSARFRVTVNMTGTVTAAFSVSAQNIAVTAQKDGFHSAVLTRGIENIRVIGTAEEIAALTNDMLYAEVDLSDAEITEGEQTVKARIVIKGSSKAWASGTYTVRIQTTAA